MIYVVSKKTISKEKQPAFLAIAKEFVDCTQKEDGCLSFALTASRTDENMLMYVERWESQAHLDAHKQSEHFVRMVPTLNAMCEKTDLTIAEDAFDLAAE